MLHIKLIFAHTKLTLGSETTVHGGLGAKGQSFRSKVR